MTHNENFEVENTEVDPARAARHDAPGRYIRNVKEDAQREKDEQAKNDQNND